MRAGTSALVIALAFGRPAFADPSAADATFDRGRTLMAQKHYAEACDAFEQSERLDPQLGTQFNLADCETHIGKLASAWAIFRELAHTDTNQARRALSAQTAADLAPRVPKLVIAIAAPPHDLHVTLDGADATSLVGVEVPVDLGAHAITATAPGFRAAATTAAITGEGKVVRVELKLDPAAAAATPPPPVATTPATPPPAALRDTPRETSHAWLGRAGWIAMWSGAGVFAGGLAFGGAAWGTYHDATHCTSCDRSGVSHTAVAFGDLSTTLVVVGLVSAGAGFYLWHTYKTSAQVVPTPGGVAIAGHF